MKYIVFLVFILFLLEVSSRLYFNYKWGIPVFHKNEIIFRYYPKLREIEERYDKDKRDIKILILGGSAVDSDLYCDIEFELRELYRNKEMNERNISVYNLAESGHTSFDSRIKRQFLSEFKFDYTFVYDGFNDCRANNIPEKSFDIDYKHFAYYNEVMLYKKYVELYWSILPFTLHYIMEGMKFRFTSAPHVPPYYKVVKDHIHDKSYWEEGKTIKTLTSFKKNLEHIYEVQKRYPGQYLILSTYAHYTPEDYSLEKFFRKELDYNEQKWPTEIFGDSELTENCVSEHNLMIQTWKDSSKVTVIELDAILPKNKSYFNDVCHITDNGCKVMAEQIFKIIETQKALH